MESSVEAGDPSFSRANPARPLSAGVVAEEALFVPDQYFHLVPPMIRLGYWTRS